MRRIKRPLAALQIHVVARWSYNASIKVLESEADSAKADDLAQPLSCPFRAATERNVRKVTQVDNSASVRTVRNCVMQSLSNPTDGSWILGYQGISRQQRNAFDGRLRDKHAIKRIFMN